MGPGQAAGQPEVVELDPATGAEVRIIARAAEGLAGCPGRAVADPLNGDLFVPGGCDGKASSAGAIYRISSPASANPGLSTFARLHEPVTALSFAPDGALYAETTSPTPASGARPASRPGQVVQVAGAGTVPISPPALIGVIPGGVGGGVAVSVTDRGGQASALEAPNRDDDVYTFPLARLPAVAEADVRSSAAPGPEATASGWGATWHRGCLYFADGAAIERACGSPPGNLSTTATSLPHPSRAFRPLARDAVDALLAATVVLLVSFAAGTANDALAEGDGDMSAGRARWLIRPKERLLAGARERLLAGAGGALLTGPGKRWAGPVGAVLAGIFSRQFP